VDPSARLGDRASAGSGRRCRPLAGTFLALALVLGACGPPEQVARPASERASAETPPKPSAAAEPEPVLPPTANPVLLDEIHAELAAPAHPGDGGGRAWLETDGGPPRLAAGEPARLVVVYEAGPLGVRPGGAILLPSKRWWFWSRPQVSDPAEPGYVEASTQAGGVELALRKQRGLRNPADRGVAVAIEGRALAPGERVRIAYGAGPARTAVDPFAERDERLWLRVDGDGDGVFGLLLDSPVFEIAAGPPARLVALLPATARLDEAVRLSLAFLDRAGSPSPGATGEVRLEASPGLEAPPRVAFRPEHAGHQVVSIRVRAPGVHRVRAVGPGGLADASNPLVVLPGTPRVLWADLHGHSNLSDGTGTPEDYFRYARDVAALDVVALTDHDHVGHRYLDATPELWERIRRVVAERHEPGRFVTLLGYEWTNWIHGHRHVLYFEDRGELLSSVDPRYDTPGALWAALRGRPALTFAHHSAGGPIATNWEIPPDPELEPVTEIASVHGSSEAVDSPRVIHDPVRDNFVLQALERGYRLGFVGSGDGHDGHPGLVQLGSAETGGLAGILCEEATRACVEEALRARRVYATNGPRIVLEVTLDGLPMGSILAPPPPGAPPARLAVRALADGAFARLEVRRGSEIVHVVAGAGRDRVQFVHELAGLRAGEWVYVRALEDRGGAAWSSPFFFE
jgi:hypothetical protein